MELLKPFLLSVDTNIYISLTQWQQILKKEDIGRTFDVGVAAAE